MKEVICRENVTAGERVRQRYMQKEKDRKRVEEGEERSLPGDVGMINVKLSERWRGETTVMGEESWPGAEKRI